jgi:hypothetical protein
LESSAVAVIFDVVLPSAAIVAGLAATKTFETAAVPPPVLGAPVMVCEPPPQAAKSAAAIQATIDNLRMSFIPRSTSVGVRN